MNKQIEISKTEDDDKGNFGVGFFIGIIIGGMLMFALGTKKGRQLVDQILEEGDQFWGKYLEDYSTPEKKGKETEEKKKQIKESVESVTDKVEAVGDLGRRAIKRFFFRQGRPLN